MEFSAFDPQLSEQDLSELGRLTVNFGYAELLLDWLLLAALDVRRPEASRLLITPLALKRKAELLNEQLPNCPNKDAAAAIKSGLKKITEANNDRNQIIHGYWALKNGIGMMAFFRKDPKKTRVKADGVSVIADKAAIATRDLYRAYNLLNSTDAERIGPDVLVPNSDGSYSVVTRRAK